MTINKVMLALAIDLSVTGRQGNKQACLSDSKVDGSNPLKGTPPNPFRRTKAQKKADKRARQAARKERV